MSIKPIYPPLKSDLHVHTACSDGSLKPSELVDFALQKKLKVIAITDHDNMNAFPEVELELEKQKLELRIIAGIEVSTTWYSGNCPYQIHIVGLGCDYNNEKLKALIDAHREKRELRVNIISAKLVKCGVNGDLLEQYLNTFRDQNTFITRKHFADFLVENKLVPNHEQAFKIYLAKGARAYCKETWCTMAEAIDAIRAAGGISVLAHPMRYNELNKKVKYRNLMVQHFVDQGGEAIEAGHPHMSPADRLVARDYAIKYNLYTSYGSDFHQPNVPYRALGEDLWLAEPTKPIWEHNKLKDFFRI